MRQICLTVVVFSAMVATSSALTIEIESTQVGGFYDDGTADNDAAVFQNYFVGHTGTLPGPVLGPERRNFFIFDLTGISELILSAELLLPTPAGGYISADAMEDYLLTGTPFDPTVISDPFAPMATKVLIFESLGSTAAPPYAGVPLTVDDFPTFPGTPGELTIPLSAAAVADLNGAAGGLFAMGGSMPTHDFDEIDEILFAFSDVFPTPLVDEPILSLTVVPEPSTIALGLVGILSLILYRSWRQRANRRESL